MLYQRMIFQMEIMKRKITIEKKKLIVKPKFQVKRNPRGKYA